MWIKHVCLPSCIKRSSRCLIFLLLFSALLCARSGPVRASAGDLDPSFGVGGKVVTSFGFDSSANAVLILPNGKIVAVGNNGSDFAVARYNSNGSLDPTFGTGGKVTTDLGGDEFVRGACLQPDGKVTAIAIERVIALDTFGLVRYNTDGSLDSTFGIDGRVVVKLTGQDVEHPFGVLLQPDGKIIAVGEAFTNGVGGILVARFNSDGSLDVTFGVGGAVFTAIAGFGGQFHGIALQQGKVVVTGRLPSNGGDFAIIRFNNDGLIDPSFGSGGMVQTDFIGKDDAAQVVAVQADGKIVAGGYSTTGPGSGLPHVALARYNLNGDLDLSFGTGGRAVETQAPYGIALAIAIQGNGGIVVTAPTVLYKVIRYTSDGTLDPSFNSSATNDPDIGLLGLAIQADNKIVGAGTNFRTDTTPMSNFVLTRYNGDIFDRCVQDDGNGNLFVFNSATGEYRFSYCRKNIEIAGRGVVKISSCKTKLVDERPDRSLSVLVNTCTGRGSVSLKSFSLGKTLTISDPDAFDNVCKCH